MTLYLRDKNNNTILDVEYWQKDGHLEISAGVVISHYSLMLLQLPKEKQLQFVLEMDNLDELRSWLWENYFIGRQNTDEDYSKVLAELREILKGAAERWDLRYVED